MFIIIIEMPPIFRNREKYNNLCVGVQTVLLHTWTNEEDEYWGAREFSRGINWKLQSKAEVSDQNEIKLILKLK